MKTPFSQSCVCRIPLLVAAGAMLILPLSCQDQAARMGKGFRLPEGDEIRGKEAFTGLKCHQCHSVAGMDFPKPDGVAPVNYPLGGEVRRVKSYGELVTAIIQPQHVVSPEYVRKLEESQREEASSPMPNHNAQMTVAQLTDIVTFLHAHYQKTPPPGVNHPYYIP